jgi:hypothetical protein
MDTRRVPATSEFFQATAEPGIETAPIRLPELVELRFVVMPRGGFGLASIIPAMILTAIVAVIAVLAIATNAGWSVLDAY